MKFIDSARRAAVFAAALAMGAAGVHAQGVTKTSIVIGQSVVLAGLGSSLARPYQEGAKLYFDRVNAAGGVNGRKLDLVTLDDNGRTVTTVANTKKLLEQGVLCLFGYYGSPQVTAAYPLIKGSDVLMFAPMSAADEFRGPDYPNIYTLRPGYSDEAAAITKHAATLGARKLAIIHAADPESLEALAAAAKAGKPNVYMLEGYIAARVLVEALRRIPGDPTRAKLKHSLEGLHDVNVGSFRVDYSKGRVGSKLVELALIDSQGRVRE